MIPPRIKADFDLQSIKSYLEKQGKQRLRQYAIDKLIEAGDRYVTDAWANADFLNHTFDLRSSIGFMVLENGKVIHKKFKTQGNSQNGVREGQQVALVEGIKASRDDLVLIVVAGMFYAIYVESHGRDVLTGSSTKVVQMLRKSLAA